MRAGEGSNFCAKLRRGGRTPAQVFSLPGERRLLIDLDSKDAAALVRSYGRNGLLARVLKVEVEDPEGRPLGAVRVLVSGAKGERASVCCCWLSFCTTMLPRRPRCSRSLPAGWLERASAPPLLVATTLTQCRPHIFSFASLPYNQNSPRPCT